MLDDWVRAETAAPVWFFCSVEVNIHQKWPEKETRVKQRDEVMGNPRLTGACGERMVQSNRQAAGAWSELLALTETCHNTRAAYGAADQSCPS